MATVRSFFEFAKEHGHRARDEFLAVVRLPHLYFPSLPELEAAGSFTTIRMSPGTAAGGEDAGQQGIIAVEKDGGANAFGMMITMGRAANNDLIVPDKRVSKFHAYFRKSGESWSVTDANSTNGTKLDGAKLEASRAYPLGSGAELELSGAILVKFLQPAELFDLLLASGVRAR